MDIYQRWLLYATLFGVLVIVLWVGQWINRRKSERRRIVIKTGPKVEKFLDPAKAVGPSLTRTAEDSRTQARKWWDRCGLNEGICGVCTCIIKAPDGYLIPLVMVAESKPYLDIAIKPLMEFGVAHDQAVEQVKEYVLSGTSPWLVCENCKDLFFPK